MNSKKIILITTGDTDGIGLEVTVKALLSSKNSKDTSLVFFRSKKEDAVAKKLSLALKKKFKVITFNSLKDALLAVRQKHKSDVLFEVLSEEPPARWVEESAQACFKNEAHAMVTAPISKQAIKDAGFKDLGHTDILKRVSNSKNAFMGFVGKHFNVVLISGHLPINHVEQSLNPALISSSFEAAQQLAGLLKTSKKKPVAVVGLNPHAGDSGLIGSFDKTILEPILAEKRKSGLLIAGPLVPDACFHKDNWSKYALYLCCYHDQGLIPFKMAHGHESGVHITLGLPIRRTSVDHGTAKDIYGKNKAQHHSMSEALALAIKLK